MSRSKRAIFLSLFGSNSPHPHLPQGFVGRATSSGIVPKMRLQSRSGLWLALATIAVLCGAVQSASAYCVIGTRFTAEQSYSGKEIPDLREIADSRCSPSVGHAATFKERNAYFGEMQCRERAEATRGQTAPTTIEQTFDSVTFGGYKYIAHLVLERRTSDAENPYESGYADLCGTFRMRAVANPDSAALGRNLGRGIWLVVVLVMGIRHRRWLRARIGGFLARLLKIETGGKEK